MPDSPLVTIRHDGPVAMLGLNRPDRRNAQTPQMLDLITSHARSLPRTTRALVLFGHGSAFCSGFDMRLVHDDPAALPALLRSLSIAVRTLRRLSIPVVVAAHGAAVAGGCALLSGGDVVVVNRDAKIGYPVLRLGISPAISIPALRQSLTDGAARERALDTHLVSGDDAVRLGLAHLCANRPEDCVSRAAQIAEHLAAKPASSIAATKALLLELEGLDADSAFDRGLTASLARAGSLEQRNRVAALWST